MLKQWRNKQDENKYFSKQFITSSSFQVKKRERGERKIICLNIKISLRGNSIVFLVVISTKFLTIMHEIYYNYHIHLFFSTEPLF